MAVAFYPGSFDPFHLGHLDVVEQAVALFGDLVIGVMHNPDKPSGMFSPAERADLVRQSVAHLGKKSASKPMADSRLRQPLKPLLRS